MERVTKRRVSNLARGVALLAFLTLFVTYGLTLDPAYGDGLTPRAGDVVVQDATGRWVRKDAVRKHDVTRNHGAHHHGTRTYRAPVHRTTPSTSMASRSAAVFASEQQLHWKDHKTYGVLHDGAVRIRVYPNQQEATVNGQPKVLKQPVVRRGGQFMLPGCVCAFFAREVSGARYAQYRTHAKHQALAAEARARRPVVPVARVPKPAPVAPPVKLQPKAAPPKPTVKRAPLQDEHPDAGWATAGVKERQWKWIVLHHSDDTSGNAAKYDRIHRHDNGWEHGLGYHFVIGNGAGSRDGQVEVGPRWTKQLHGAHAKTPDNRFNDYGVGICLVGDFDTGSGRPTAAQMDHLVRLVRWLQARYGISNNDVLGHCDCCPTACPGKNFPWDELRRRIR